MENKKIKNATKCLYDGILFNSKSEKDFYIVMKDNGLNPLYEPDKFLLWEGFKPLIPLYIDGEPILNRWGTINKLTDWHYTPDFRIDYNGYVIYIEVKGFGNDLWTYKRKLFYKLIHDKPNVRFFEVKTKRGLLKTINLIKQL